MTKEVQTHEFSLWHDEAFDTGNIVQVLKTRLHWPAAHISPGLYWLHVNSYFKKVCTEDVSP